MAARDRSCSWPACHEAKTTQTERWHLEGAKPWLCARHLAELSALPYRPARRAMELVMEVSAGGGGGT